MRVFYLNTLGKTVLSLKIWILLVYELQIHVPCKNFGQTYRSISLPVFVVDIYADCAANVRFWLLSSCATFCLVKLSLLKKDKAAFVAILLQGHYHLPVFPSKF